MPTLDARTPFAVVLCANRIVGVGLARCLGRERVPVIGVTYHPVPKGLLSKHVRIAHALPNAFKRPDDFLDSLIALGKRYPGAVLFPTSDSELAILARNAPALAPHFRFTFPEWSAIAPCLDKTLTYDLASRLGIPVPRVWWSGTSPDLADLPQDLLFPCLVKRVMRRNCAGRLEDGPDFDDLYGSKALRVHDLARLTQVTDTLSQRSIPFIVQEEIPGPSENLVSYGACLDRNSRPLAQLVALKLRQVPDDFGDGSIVETRRCDPVRALATRLLAAIGFHGIAQVEFKRDPRDGRFKLIEINPRAWSWIVLSAVAGANVPYAAYCDAVGIPFTSTAARLHRRFLTLYWDERTIARNGPKALASGRLTLARLRHAARGIHCCGFFNPSDLGPTLHEIAFALAHFPPKRAKS